MIHPCTIYRKHKSAYAEYNQKKLEELDRQESSLDLLQESSPREEFKRESVVDDLNGESIEEDGYHHAMLEVGLKVESQESQVEIVQAKRLKQVTKWLRLQSFPSHQSKRFFG